MEKRHSQWNIKLIPTSSQHNPSFKSDKVAGIVVSWHQFFIFPELSFLYLLAGHWATPFNYKLKNLTAAALQFHVDTMTVCSVPQDWNDSTGFMECTVPVPTLMRNHYFTPRDLVIVIYHLG
jgi:hypothetical protein